MIQILVLLKQCLEGNVVLNSYIREKVSNQWSKPDVGKLQFEGLI